MKVQARSGEVEMVIRIKMEITSSKVEVLYSPTKQLDDFINYILPEFNKSNKFHFCLIQQNNLFFGFNGRPTHALKKKNFFCLNNTVFCYKSSLVQQNNYSVLITRLVLYVQFSPTKQRFCLNNTCCVISTV